MAENSPKTPKLVIWSVDTADGKLKNVEYNAGGAGERGGEGAGGWGTGGEGGVGHACPKCVPVVTREAMEDQAAGMGPHRLGLPERLSEVRVLSLDQLAGIVDKSPSELRSSEVRVERLDQEAGRVPPRVGDLRGAMMSEIN